MLNRSNCAEVIEGIEPAKLQAALEGRTVQQAHRKGKHMWIEFDSGPCLMLHFGEHIIPCSVNYQHVQKHASSFQTSRKADLQMVLIHTMCSCKAAMCMCSDAGAVMYAFAQHA